MKKIFLTAITLAAMQLPAFAQTDAELKSDGKGGKGDGFGGFDGKGFGGDATGPAQTPCTSAADCTGKCGANATAGCTCAANATGALTCHPACATDADCPTVKLPNGAVFTCTGGACVVTP